MKFSTKVIALAFSALTAPAIAESSCCRRNITTQEYHEQLGKDYLALWNGKYDLAPSIIDPNFKLYADLFPFGPDGPVPLAVDSREAFVAFIESARAGWEEYFFEPRRSVAYEYSQAVRWTMQGVIGQNFTTYPTPLEPGSHVSYNGTDFLAIDECTGLIREVDMAQDLITYYNSLQLGSIPV